MIGSCYVVITNLALLYLIYIFIFFLLYCLQSSSSRGFISASKERGLVHARLLVQGKLYQLYNTEKVLRV